MATIIYYPSFFGKFIGDDVSYFQHNDILMNLSPLDFKAIFLYPSNNWGELLPVRDYLYVLEYTAFKEWTTGYHIISLTLFLFSAFVSLV